jgi:aerobic-type carbon monoxide dehydrogenase small subunit (CoxS/CutS family)
MTPRREVSLDLTVNDRRRRVRVPPMKRLLDVLREECGLTGTKEGCGEGECGACTVLIDGRSVNSCLVPAVQAAGARILTVEGLASGARLNRLQQAFTTMGAAQCGICTPGMLMTAHELLSRARRVPSEDEVREALAGNLCRCTGYQKIVDAVRAAARDQLKPKRGAGTKPPRRRRRAAPKAKRRAAPRRRVAPRGKRK